MQGNRTSEQQVKICLLPGEHTRIPETQPDGPRVQPVTTDEEPPSLLRSLLSGAERLRLRPSRPGWAGPDQDRLQVMGRAILHGVELLLTRIGGGVNRCPSLWLGFAPQDLALRGTSASRLRQQALEALLCRYEAGQPVDQLQLAVLAGLVTRAPSYAFALDSAAELVAAGMLTGPRVEDVPCMDHSSQARGWQRREAVLILDGLCAAQHFCSAGPQVRQALRHQTVALGRAAQRSPQRWRSLAPLAREILCCAPPREGDLALPLWQTLAMLDGGCSVKSTSLIWEVSR